MSLKKTLIVKDKVGTFQPGEYPLDKMTPAKHKEATQLVARGRARWKIENATAPATTTTSTPTAEK